MKKLLFMIIAGISMACEASSLVFIRNGNAEGKIFYSADASSSEKLAADELIKFLREISGAEVTSTDLSPQNNGIVIGTVKSKYVPPELIARLKKSKSDEAFYIKQQDDKLYLIGKTPVASLYATYTLLEQVLGLRFFQPQDGGTYISYNKNVTFNNVDIYMEPAFEFRRLDQVIGGGNPHISREWATRNKMHMPGAYVIQNSLNDKNKSFFQTRIPARVFSSSGHLCFYNAVPPTKYLKSHPEYFALVNGKRQQKSSHSDCHHCLANPAVQDLTVKYIFSFIETYGKQTMFVFGAPDSTVGWCECPNCSALDEKGESNMSSRFHKVVTKIAARVYEKCPDANLAVWAYWNYRPFPKNVKFDPRMTIYFCPAGRCYAHRLDDSSCRRNVEIFTLMKKWLETTGKMYIYEYLNSVPSPCAALPLEEVVASDLKLYRKLGIKGWKAEIYPFDAYYSKRHQAESFDYPNLMNSSWQFWYVVSKLLWNPDADLNALLADAESKYYGKAYPAMKQYHDLRRKTWENTSGCFGWPNGDDRSPRLLQKPGLQDKLLQLLEQADQLAKGCKKLEAKTAMDRKYLGNYWIKKNIEFKSRQGKRLFAPITDGEIKIDAMFSDASWTKACYTSDFLTANTANKAALPPELTTSVGILSDKHNLYFQIVAMEPEPGKIVAAADNGGKVWKDDSIEIFIAPPNESNRYYQVAVNPRGKIFTCIQPGNDSNIDLGVKAAAKITENSILMEIKLPVDKMEGNFAPGMNWNIQIARNRMIKDKYPAGNFSLDGERYHEISAYRPLSIGKALIVNGGFNELDKSGENLRAWKLNANAELKKMADNKYNVLLKRSASIKQLIWDWKGPLGQSSEAKNIEIIIKASGKGRLFLSAQLYHDDWSGGNLKRKSFPSEQIGDAKLSEHATILNFNYTIKPERWIGLIIYTTSGEATLENISIIKK